MSAMFLPHTNLSSFPSVAAAIESKPNKKTDAD
jgi:hypothetical protein